MSSVDEALLNKHSGSAVADLPELRVVHVNTIPARDDWQHFWSLSRTLAAHEIRRRYFGSFLGHAWALLRPMMLFAVMYVVFSHVVRVGSDVPHYPIYLLSSIVVWTFFLETTSTGVGSLLAHEHLMRKINFPRLVIPFSLAITASYQFLLNLLVVLVFALASGVEPRVTWLGMLPLLVFFAIFAIGMSLILSALFVRFRDVQPIWDVGGQVLFWASPIIYVATFPPEGMRQVLACSPISSTLTQMRFWFIDPSAPTAADVLGSPALLLIPLAIGICALLVGIALFRRVAPRVAELS